MLGLTHMTLDTRPCDGFHVTEPERAWERGYLLPRPSARGRCYYTVETVQQFFFSLSQYTKVLKKSESMDGRSGISYSISSTASSAKSDETAESGIVVDKRLPPIESSLDTIPGKMARCEM